MYFDQNVETASSLSSLCLIQEAFTLKCYETKSHVITAVN